MSQDDLKTRLLHSNSVSSLASEQQIIEQLDKLGWSVAHGSFFPDPNTAKLREIDVSARRSWQRGPEPGKQSAGLNLILEVKSIGGYHLVFAPISGSLHSASAQREWVGYASDHKDSRERLGSVLEDSGAELATIRLILEQFYDLAYPEDAVSVGELIVDPPTAPFVSSAFRETNVGGEKELDASVLWKATQTLNSVTTHAHTYYSEGLFETVERAAYYARLLGFELVDHVLSELAHEVRRLHLFHPVVVVDAMLWALDSKKLEKLP